MRGGGWSLFLLATLIFALVVILPLAAAVALLAGLPPTPTVPVAPWQEISLRTGAWALLIALGAVIAAWFPARVLASRSGGGGVLAMAALCLIPMCLPPHVPFWLWWRMWGADVPLFDWIRDGGWESLARSATLWLGLVSWSWPIAAITIAASLSHRSSEIEAMLRMDGAGFARRAAAAIRAAAPGIVTGGVIVFLFAFNNTTCFDLAQVRTLGYELRAMDSLGAAPAQVLGASWPGVAVAFGCVLALATLAKAKPPTPEATRARAGRGLWLGLAIVVCITLLVPLGFLLSQVGELQALPDLWKGYRTAAANSGVASLCAGIIGLATTLGLGAAWSDRRRIARTIANVQLIGWVLAAALPGMVVAIALEAAFNRPGVDDAVYRSPAILVIVVLARYGFVAAFLGAWLASQESREERSLRAMDGAETLRGQWRALKPRWIAAGGASAAVIAVLGMGEVEVMPRVQPPRYEAIAGILLNNMHYQRNEMVVATSLLLILLATGSSLLAAMAWRGARGMGRSGSTGTRFGVPVLLGAVLLIAPGCSTESDGIEPLDPVIVFGEPGPTLGQFNYARAMDVDPDRQVLYVIDRSGRVQRFGIDGEPQRQWLLPEFDNGYPTGVTVAPDGRVFVADTHEYRVSVFDGEGTLLETFGTHGAGPGQFNFLTDVAFGPEGRIYVSEFGGNDRIQVFDADWTRLFEFGGFGPEPGRFNRPQSMCFNPQRTELWVADACNHRLQVFDPDGKLLRVVGGIGSEPGRFRYPYGVTILDDGAVVVAEFGNNRVQFLSPDGAPRRVLGGTGSEPGQLLCPWGAAAFRDTIFVLDSRNSRIQVIERPRGS